MGKFLKYLLSAIVVLAFWNCTDKSAPTVAEGSAVTMSIEETAYQTNISESESELCLPRQVSFANSNRVQSTARRSTGTNRNNIEFTKSGRVLNSGIRYFVQRNSIISHSTLVEPAHRLLYLGKLII